jgi:predicted nucleic acid-binding Zn ribbon protein
VTARRRDDRNPATYDRLRARKAAERARLERRGFDPSPPTDDDWTVADRDGLRRVPVVPSAVAEVAAALAEERGWEERLQGVALFDAWPDVVGADVARHCRPVRLAGGVLTVEAVSPSWATQLTYLATRLRVAANTALQEPRVDRVVVVVARQG